MKRLLKYFEGNKLASILAPLMKLSEALLELLVPLLVARVIDYGIPTGDIQEILPTILHMFLIAFIGFVLATIAQYLSAKAAVGYTKNLSDDLYQHVMRLGQRERDLLTSSTLISALTSDTNQIQLSLNMLFRLFLRSPFIVGGALIMAIRIDQRLTSYFVGMVLALFVIIYMNYQLASPVHRDIRESYDQLVTLSREQMQGMRVIRAFQQEDREINEFKQTNDSLTRQSKLAGLINILVNPLTYLAVNLSLIAVIWQGGNFVNAGSLSQGELVALINYLLQILVELVKITMFVNQTNRALVSARRILKIFDMPQESASFDNPSYFFGDDDKSLVVDNVSFSYPLSSQPALDQINLVLRPGQFVGIIGGTGSGKTTLLRLLTKVYDPDSGNIAYNPQQFDLDSRSSLRDQIAVVPGQVNLFQGTIRSNLLLANPQADDDLMWQALRQAQAEEFVADLAEGLDAVVEPYGRNFSGGQRQRLTIARALIKPAHIYIFDDSTSALDYLTEARFQALLREEFSDKIIVMVSQRTRSLMQADQILVLDGGRQVGLGQHEDLMRLSEVYREIHQSQMSEEVASHEN